ncbi:SDR family NAD(P)-dependent oxidoreductase [Neptunicella marina]|uniref:SDR family NAD(P)-dependent oxidoreductase n=1 Tax=Neptunicella marina TaxID=2125989 RepID=A0A8J6IPY4_9ALTE|nr:SDR family NAD(P)-dependent oxidoreductase [Neptunicella marina]MBC3764429.1 SDR family NAD(P)-dependent oxidoreductase [Neptunicella marina]
MSLNEVNRIWLVGASRGIGKALFHELDRDGRTLFISARDEAALNNLSQQSLADVQPLPLDITQPEQVERAVADIADRIPQLDLVIINAGSCEYIDSEQPSLSAFEHMMKLNFMAPLTVLKQVMPLLKHEDKKRLPTCVFISSSVHYFALPRAAAYGASKAALSYMVESLATDLQHRNLHLALVHPGFVKTDLTDANDFPMPFLLSAEQAAKRIVKGLGKGQCNISFPRRLIWPLRLLGILPANMQRLIGGKLSRLRQHKEK